MTRWPSGLITPEAIKSLLKNFPVITLMVWSLRPPPSGSAPGNQRLPLSWDRHSVFVSGNYRPRWRTPKLRLGCSVHMSPNGYPSYVFNACDTLCFHGLWISGFEHLAIRILLRRRCPRAKMETRNLSGIFMITYANFWNDNFSSRKD